MAQHVLSLEVPDTLNKCVLRVVDTSVYNGTPECPLLQITLPGFSVPAELTPDPYFIGNYTACTLGIQTVNCGTNYVDLPDGIYIIKYSVKPHEYAYVEYNHLRITTALNIIQCILCDLDLGTCDPREDIKAKLNQITLIKRYLDAAKAKVEYCLEPANGMQLYNYAIKLLNKLACNTNCGTCSTC